MEIKKSMWETKKKEVISKLARNTNGYQSLIRGSKAISALSTQCRKHDVLHRRDYNLQSEQKCLKSPDDCAERVSKYLYCTEMLRSHVVYHVVELLHVLPVDGVLDAVCDVKLLDD